MLDSPKKKVSKGPLAASALSKPCYAGLAHVVAVCVLLFFPTKFPATREARANHPLGKLR